MAFPTPTVSIVSVQEAPSSPTKGDKTISVTAEVPTAGWRLALTLERLPSSGGDGHVTLGAPTTAELLLTCHEPDGMVAQMMTQHQLNVSVPRSVKQVYVRVVVHSLGRKFSI